jgi:hypothetical protein
MHDENGETHVSTEEARGGATPHMTRYILGFSLIAIIAIFAIVLLI